MRKRWLTPEREAWLRENYSKGTLAETVEAFNKRFGTAISYVQMQSANSNHGYGKANRKTCKTFEPWEEGWLHDHLPRFPLCVVQECFDLVWGWTPGKSTLKNYRNRHGLRGALNIGRFHKGSVPPNKGLKGYYPPGSEKGWFKKGNVPKNKAPLYAERWVVRDSGGSRHLAINVPIENPYTGANNFWIRKAVWVWMQANQREVPEGHAIVQLDGDPRELRAGQPRLRSKGRSGESQ